MKDIEHPREPAGTTTIRVSAAFADMVALVARHRRLRTHAYLDRHVLPLIESQYEEEARARLSELGGEGG